MITVGSVAAPAYQPVAAAAVLLVKTVPPTVMVVPVYGVEPLHKMFNLDVLKPLYEKYHPRGLEIYAISVNADKVAWAQTVKAQELPWINVNDGLGTASGSLYAFNVQSIPSMLLLSADGTEFIPGERQLRAKLEKQLR